MNEPSASQLAQFFGSIRRGPHRLGVRAMPWLMFAGIWLSAFFLFILILFIPLAALGQGTYTINNRYVSGPYFLTHAYPILFPFMLLVGALAYGYWTERLWARPLPIFFWLGIDVLLLWGILTGDDTRADNLGTAIWGVLFVVGAIWYCFYKRSVANYYLALERAFRQGEAGTKPEELSSAKVASRNQKP